MRDGVRMRKISADKAHIAECKTIVFRTISRKTNEKTYTYHLRRLWHVRL